MVRVLKAIRRWENKSIKIASGSAAKNPLRCRRRGFDPWAGKIPWRRKDNPLQSSCLDSMNRGNWWAIVHGVKSTRTQLSAHTHTHTRAHTHTRTRTHKSEIKGLFGNMNASDRLSFLSWHVSGGQKLKMQ